MSQKPILGKTDRRLAPPNRSNQNGGTACWQTGKRIETMTSSSLSRLGLGYWHLGIWLILWFIAALMARYSCTEYNKIAGTDLTSEHMLRISASMVFGPMVGPIANPGISKAVRDVAMRFTGFLLFLQIVAICPFVFFGRNMPIWATILSWIFFVVCGMAWFYGGLVSLGLSLM